jgi:hypothetical protein
MAGSEGILLFEGVGMTMATQFSGPKTKEYCTYNSCSTLINS